MPKKPFAVFSDVHSNLEALEAVLADMDERSIKSRVCLGDIVGYAANPAQCLERVRKLECPVLRGNHDDAVGDALAVVDMRDSAWRGVEFSRKKLSATQRAYLASLPLSFTRGAFQFVHASLSNPQEWTYILRESDARAHFAAQKKRLSFCGHTHVPIVLHLNDTGEITHRFGNGRMLLPETGKVLINVGSVGQPRDNNNAACYVLCDPQGGWVEFRRVPYDFEKTQGKILRAKLPQETAQRLGLGY